MKLGVVGKGGVGKTTVAALLARQYSARGDRVVVVETDSNPNLGLSLGLSEAEMDAVPAVPRGAVVGGGGGVSAASLLTDFARPTPAGVTLVSALRITEAGAGCTCGGHATVRSLLSEALEDHADVTIVDMEAGLEHLSRSGGTLAHADVLLVVMEPSRKSVLTAVRTMALASELGIRRILGIGNKARAEDEHVFEDAAARHEMDVAGILPYEPAVAGADREGTALAEVPPGLGDALERIIARIAAGSG